MLVSHKVAIVPQCESREQARTEKVVELLRAAEDTWPDHLMPSSRREAGAGKEVVGMGMTSTSAHATLPCLGALGAGLASQANVAS